MSSDLDRHAAGDFAHRLEKRERAVSGSHRFVGDADRTGFHKTERLILIRGEVQVSEEYLAGAQHRDFGRLRLLHLHDHVGGIEHGLRIGKDVRAGLLIGLVGAIDAVAGMGLDEQLVPVGDELRNRCGGQADTIFVDLDFLWHSDAHLFVRSD